MTLYRIACGWLIAFLLTGVCSNAQLSDRIIPQPVFFEKGEGVFKSNKKFSTGEYAFVKVDSIQKEGYHITVDDSGVKIEASTEAGQFYALKTLTQASMLDSASGTWSIPYMKVIDYPAFSYRGMHLDVSRHFFSLAYLKRFIELLAYYKINTFHWHLTDSHGWRMEIKKYPRLTSVGAWRADRSSVPFTLAPPTRKDEPKTYGGFYTQEQVKDLIQFAKERHITIIPEIEVPGHCTAALVAYPQYTCLNNPVPLLIPNGYPGDLKHNFCPGYDSTFVFIQNVLDEVMELFPSEYIHIGGDEVRPQSWLNCPRCQKRMKEENLKDANELQAYFTKRIDGYIASKNRKMIGWDEIMEANLSKNAAVMSWRGTEGGIEAARTDHSAVMAPYRFVYFDFYQSSPEHEPDISYAGLSLDKVYQFNPIPDELDMNARKHIMGGQACLWTENIRTEKRLEYMLLPRMLALAECVWSPVGKKDYRNFIDRVEVHQGYLNNKKINYARSMYNIGVQPRYDSVQKQISVGLSNQMNDKYEMKYTVDGTDPKATSKTFTDSIVVAKNTILKTALFNKEKQLGKITSEVYSIHKGFASYVISSKKFAEGARLTDGIHGTVEPYDGRWVFFEDSVTITVDLGKTTQINSIKLNVVQDWVGNAVVPESIEYSYKHGNIYELAAKYTNTTNPRPDIRRIKTITQQTKISARFVRIKMKAPAFKNPENPSHNLIFIDELILR